jgi:hypothetical protein
MPTALFIGLEHLFKSMQLDRDKPSDVVHASDLSSAMSQFRRLSPKLVLLPSTINGVCRGGFLGLLKRRYPDCHATVIIFDAKKQGNELTIYSWDSVQRSFVSRSSSMDRLRQEIQTALDWEEDPTPVQDEIPKAIKDEIKTIGFYNCVEVKGRSFHVQTEIISRELMQVKSTVLEGGTVLDTSVQPYPTHLDDRIQGEAFIQAQHEKMVEQVNQGKYS